MQVLLFRIPEVKIKVRMEANPVMRVFSMSQMMAELVDDVSAIG